MYDFSFWKNKRVFLTGHTGFKGAWLSLWLTKLGAKVTGYSLLPTTELNLFELCNIQEVIHKSIIGDIRNLDLLQKSMLETGPDVVIHMAAQPLVKQSYLDPIETYSTNVMGTVHLFEAIRKTEGIKAVLNVTTDKCYDNKEWIWGYRENEQLGGYDPYSNSKACSELITSSYRNSFFNQEDYTKHGVAIATARAGNVIGGGDWSKDRLIPDIINSLLNDSPIIVRNPNAIRPWQHVLEPLSGYLLIAEKLFCEGTKYAEAWNLGPYEQDVKSVQWIVERFCKKWEGNLGFTHNTNDEFHESNYLKLDCSKAINRLNWRPKWTIEKAIDKIIEWNLSFKNDDNVLQLCERQIYDYSSL